MGESGSAKSCGKQDHVSEGVYGCYGRENSVGGIHEIGIITTALIVI